jgi:hypothetical protein
MSGQKMKSVKEESRRREPSNHRGASACVSPNAAEAATKVAPVSDRRFRQSKTGATCLSGCTDEAAGPRAPREEKAALIAFCFLDSAILQPRVGGRRIAPFVEIDQIKEDFDGLSGEMAGGEETDFVEHPAEVDEADDSCARTAKTRDGGHGDG